MRRTVFLLALVGSLPAHADTDAAPEGPLAQARKLYADGDFVHAREQLLLAYKEAADPEILFALGQVEFNLEHFAEAIAYYEQFLTTNPTAEQAALAQQAIGAARARVAQPPSQPPPPPPVRTGSRHRWQLLDTGLTTLGAASIVGGAVLLYVADRRSSDESGSLAEYDRRLAHAKSLRLAGIALGAGGVVAIAAAVLHWRLHTETFEIQPIATSGATGVSLVRAW